MTIKADRTENSTKVPGSESRYGSFYQSVPLPAGAKEADIARHLPEHAIGAFEAICARKLYLANENHRNRKAAIRLPFDSRR
ncbi:Hsp20/alpha crystallin family protein [Rhodococcus sp. IEGM 1366]|uniref:Hsp20/alpha crystallin family protein n=1 Tax=Rhodococcus sp. IEGM 1366 TaxID=3082223 RepID=UPI0029538A8B|nr:Hsp20/alpha crystallin family protein [Rhodococcus sp. IEGM 1366]MDV8070897.1 Hsp20/alpha crystallin family protein [Rhodococcus sp. IEGM 1366]